MEVHLPDDQKAFVRQSIESGRYNGEEDALREALSKRTDQTMQNVGLEPSSAFLFVNLPRPGNRFGSIVAACAN